MKSVDVPHNRDIAVVKLFQWARNVEVVRNAVNDEVGNKYPTLRHVADVLDEALKGSPYAYYQNVHVYTHGSLGNGLQTVVEVVTKVFEIGDTAELIREVPVAGIVPLEHPNQAQAIGSMITYFRRYSLMNAFGLIPPDDDGNAVAVRPPGSVPDVKMATPNQVALIRRLVEERNISDHPNPETMTFAEASEYITSILGKKK